MVVCRCRKATKFYCFVHKVPVCGECTSLPEHQLCVIKTYSEWVIDADYDWPPRCGFCEQVLQETDDVTRLGCFHVVHSHCLEEHLCSLPSDTAPAGYVCPSCSTPIWPPKLVQEPSSGLHSKLKQIITQGCLLDSLDPLPRNDLCVIPVQSGVATTLLGKDVNALSSGQRVAAPPAFSSSPLVSTAATPAEENGPSTSVSPLLAADGTNGGLLSDEVKHIHDSGSSAAPKTSSSIGSGTGNLGSVPGATHFTKGGPSLTGQLPNGAMARKNPSRGDSSNISMSEFDEDEDDNDDDDDGIHRKYSWRGPLHQQLLRSFLPFWSPALPSLPVTTPSYRDKRDAPGAEDIIDGRTRRKQRNIAAVDSRKILLWFAIMSCMATVLLLYYRLSQGFGGIRKYRSIH